MKDAKPENATNVDPLRQVVSWIVAGHSQADIKESIAKLWPRAKSRPLIVAAVKEIAAASEEDPDLIVGFALTATREIYRKAMEVGDHQTALRALKQLKELSTD